MSVVFVHYDSIGDILKPSSDPGVTDYLRYAGTGEITVNSRVVAAAVKPADVYQLDHVTFTLRHSKVQITQSADDRITLLNAPEDRLSIENKPPFFYLSFFGETLFPG